MSQQLQCPDCGQDWDGGDIREAMANLDVNNYVDASVIEKLASMYGWTPEERKRFTKVKVYEIERFGAKFTFWECPKCFHVLHRESGRCYVNIAEARNQILIPETVEDEVQPIFKLD